ncbi:MAG: nitric-oxide reductase large subunit [Armatimonadetes bacterium]|nr:nitric-oxide reductase large subunit [Armatimonadota bacterium]
MAQRRLWMILGLVLLVSFGILGGLGFRINSLKPPIPAAVQTADGHIIMTHDDITNGQNVWQSIGGQELGSIWGHGAYLAPDWTADWLHRELTALLDIWARQEGARDFRALSVENQAALKARLKEEIRTNSFDSATGIVTISADRAEAIKQTARHYDEIFTKGEVAFALQPDAVKDKEQLREMTSFFFWTSWAASTNRPDAGERNITYTQNWPHEPLIDNQLTPDAVIWSVISFVLLLAGIGSMVWYFGSQERTHQDEGIPDKDPLLGYTPTPSQKATLKYFFVVGALFVLQMLMGVVAGHYGVEGGGFYGFDIQRWLPYSVARTWHLQLGIFWIATAWLATGLYLAPAVGGGEPKFQKAGVNFLFVALLIIVLGSLFGEWASIKRMLGGDLWFWFGHQGYEYVDLGRFWQLFLLIGLFLWLFLMVRALWPAFHRPSEQKSLLGLFILASASIGLFYCAGLGIWQQTHLAMAEYWRWWVVHLWVEGFFEVFATVAIAFLFSRLRLIKPETATNAVLFATIIFLSGGIVGTAHHLYFAGTPSVVMAFGAVFSALEVVPLVLIGFEAWENVRMSRVRSWASAYRWAIYFFIAVAFWNLVGAGLFGFFINPPVALYYMQGLNTTPVHGHTALFGVYGMLGVGLMLFCVRSLMPGREWKEGPLRFAFWSLNIGLMLMVLLSLLPVGLIQTWASVATGLWYARSPEFLQSGWLPLLRWMRIPGDTIFFIGALAIGWFMVGLLTGHSFEKGREVEAGSVETQPTPSPAGK